MIRYLLKRTDGRGGYVAPAGSARSYVHDTLKARRFPTIAAAEAERCPVNETIVPVDIPFSALA
ncbi:MAG: hypothetical protein M0R28_20990 [Pigmentiphaga sp.]|nr:hypothetical protein [Pigmentiphaga sp.]